MNGKANTSKKDEGRLWAGDGADKRKKAAASGKPKCPPSTFFVFMYEFRQEYQAHHPGNKSIAAVSKAAGEKWCVMLEQEKQPYVDQAGQKKQDYEKTKANFDKKESTSSKKAKTEDEDGSKSVVDDEDDEENDDDE